MRIANIKKAIEVEMRAPIELLFATKFEPTSIIKGVIAFHSFRRLDALLFTCKLKITSLHLRHVRGLHISASAAASPAMPPAFPFLSLLC